MPGKCQCRTGISRGSDTWANRPEQSAWSNHDQTVIHFWSRYQTIQLQELSQLSGKRYLTTQLSKGHFTFTSTLMSASMSIYSCYSTPWSLHTFLKILTFFSHHVSAVSFSSFEKTHNIWKVQFAPVHTYTHVKAECAEDDKRQINSTFMLTSVSTRDTHMFPDVFPKS